MTRLPKALTAVLKSHGLYLETRIGEYGGARYVVRRTLKLSNGRTVDESMTADEAERHGRSLIEYAERVRQSNKAAKLGEFRDAEPVTNQTR